MAPNKVLSLQTSGRKLVGPAEGYSIKRARQVNDWLQKLPATDALDELASAKGVGSWWKIVEMMVNPL